MVIVIVRLSPYDGGGRHLRVARAVILTPEQRQNLEANARAQSLPVRLVEPSRIALMAAAGVKEIVETVRALGPSPLSASKPTESVGTP